MHICQIENVRYIHRKFAFNVPKCCRCKHCDRASSSGAPYYTSKPVSRIPSPVDSALNNGQPRLRTIGDLMAGTTEPETVTRNKDLGEAGKDDLSDLFEFCGSDNELAIGPVRRRKKVCILFRSVLRPLLTQFAQDCCAEI